MEPKDPKERALEYVKKHLAGADAADGSLDGKIHISKAQEYLNHKIAEAAHANNLLEVEHLTLFQHLIDRFKEKEERSMPQDWKIKFAWSSELRDWFKAHPNDNCDGHAHDRTR